MSFKTPGVYIREVEAALPRPLRMSVTGFVGQAERGPLNYPQLITNWGQFRDIFGSFVGYSYLSYAVFGFFSNGGERCYVVRVAHETARKATRDLVDQKGRYLFSVGPEFVDELNRSEVSEALREQFSSRGRALTPPIRVEVEQAGSRWRIFDANTSFSVRNQDRTLNVYKGRPAIRISAIDAGDWANAVSVALDDQSTAEFVLTELASDMAGGKDIAVFKSVAGLVGTDTVGTDKADVVTLIDPRNPFVREDKLRIKQISFDTKTVTFDRPVRQPFPAGSRVLGKGFRLVFRYQPNGRVVREEVFDNLSMEETNDRYFVNVVNGNPEEKDYVKRMANGTSILVRVENPCAGSPTACARPQSLEAAALEDGHADPSQLDVHYYTGYRNGAYFRPRPFDATAVQLKALEEQLFGLAVFEIVPEIGLVVIPDLSIPDFYKAAVIPPEIQIPKEGIIFAKIPSARLTPDKLGNLKSGQRDMLSHCEKMGDRSAILDSPRGAQVSRGSNKIEEWPSHFQPLPNAKYGALYYPWIKEQAADFAGRKLFIPPSGHLAGIYARSENERGIGKAPANEMLQGVVELELCLSDAEQEILNPIGVNCLRMFPGRGLRVWGARTLSLDPQWRYVNVRRVCLAIIKQILVNLQWTVFEPNDRGLWDKIVVTLTLFLRDLFQSGALAGTKPEEAFFVKCDEETNPPDAVERGQVTTVIGIAPARPAEFILVTILRTPEAVSVREQ